MCEVAYSLAMPFLAVLAVAAAAQPNLAKFVLKPTQVGPGYVLQLPVDGQGVGHRTLDLCGTTNYPSEKLRVDRLQVDYLRTNAKLKISNEVVRYKPGGAAQAMREAARHAVTCPNKPIAFEGQPPLTYHLTTLHDAKLLKGYIAVREHVTGRYKGKRIDVTAFVSYQRKGDVISGVYSYSLPGVSQTAQQAFFLHAAEQSARDLRGSSPAGGVPA